MIFQSGKYCDILADRVEEDVSIFSLRIRDKGQDTHLGIWATDLSHALELWTAIERSPEVKLVVNVNDYIVKGETFPCPYCEDGYPWPNEEQRDFHITYTHRDEFADCKHREFDLEEMA